MAELHWFPFFAKDWLSSPARMAMRPEQRGAYIDLLAVAWGNGDEPPGLNDNDVELASLSGLGRRWKDLGPLIKAQFIAAEGRLTNQKLTEVWHEQQSKHSKAVERGKTGGRTRADNLKSKSRLARDTGIDRANQSESEEAVESLTGSLPASAPGGALGVEVPRAPAQTAQINNGTTGPWRDPAPLDPDADRLAAEYFARLNARVDKWAADNPDDALEVERVLRAEMGLPRNRELSEMQRRALRERFLVEIREQRGWPGPDEWVTLEKARLLAGESSEPSAASEAA